MKWTALIVTFTALYSLAACNEAKKTPAAQPPQPTPIPAVQPPHTNALKAPLDKAHDTFQKIQKQNKEEGL